MEDQVTVFTQGYYSANKTETMTLGEAARLLRDHGAFPSFIAALKAIESALAENGQFKRASPAPGVWFPIITQK